MSRNPTQAIGLLGGSYDPVHRGHLELARKVRLKFQLDSVVFIPAFLSPHKLDHPSAAPGHRLEMLRLALASHPDFDLSEVELKRKGPSYTVDTLRQIKNERPDPEYFLIMGQDSFEGLETWKDARKLLEECHLIVAHRPGGSREFSQSVQHLLQCLGVSYQPAPSYEGVTCWRNPATQTTLQFFNMPPMQVSSSEVRKKIAAGEEIRNLLPPEVENYIIKNQLYRA